MPRAEFHIKPKETISVWDPNNPAEQAANCADPRFEHPGMPAPFDASTKRVTSSLPHLEAGTGLRQHGEI